MFHARKNQSCTIIVNLVIKRLENMNLDNQQKLQSLKHFFYKSLRKANQNIFNDFQSSIVIYKSLINLLCANITLFQKIPKYDIAKVFLGLGITHINIEDYPKAKKYLKKALQFDESSQDIFFYNGIADYNLKKLMKLLKISLKQFKYPVL